MNKKKLLAVLCTCTLLFALAVPAFASNNAMTNPTENTFEGSDMDGELTVSVSVLKGANKLYVNPYGLPYTIREGSATGAGANGEKIKEGITTDGWFSTTSVIKNESTKALKISVTMKTVERSANVKVVANEAAVAANSAFNCLYGNLEIAPADYNSTSKLITPDWASKEEVPVPTVASPLTTATYTNIDIDAADDSQQDAAGDPIITPAFAAFRIRGHAVLGSGEATGADATAGGAAEWAKGDLADVTVAFSFEPVTPEP